MSTEPLPSLLKPLDVPAGLVLELAAGLTPPLELAERYGLNEAEFGALSQYPPFRAQVEQKKAELQASGYTFRMQNAMYAEEMGKQLFLIAAASDTTFNQKHDFYRTVTKFADLEPKPTAAQALGAGFSIVINFDQKPVADPTKDAIDVTPTLAPTPTPIIGTDVAPAG